MLPETYIIPDETIEKISLKAVDTFMESNFKDGDIVSMHWLKEFLQIKEAIRIEDVNNIQWDLLAKMELFKEELLTKHQIALRNVRGSGYLIVPPRQQAEFAVEEGIKAFNKGMRRTDRLLNNVRRNKMDNTENKRHTDAQVKFSAIKNLLKKEKVNIFSIFENTKMVEE